MSHFQNTRLAERNGVSATLSVSNWLGLTLLSVMTLIPGVGVLFWITIYFFLGRKIETAPTVCSFIHVNLIVSVIVTIISSTAVAVIFWKGASLLWDIWSSLVSLVAVF